ncbi:MAG: tRNA uridine-5-carboxymethylaminomethyl(34) synthesis enzyme MnmG [Candidatus Omnitrophota bacterium]
MSKEYDVIVVGGGHAGCEASLAASKLGCKTLLLTMNMDTIGLMSCNPAIGGLAKGQLVKEIDALGGQMARATDATTIQFRLLNTKKGPAVRSSRAQVDRQAYRLYMRSAMEAQSCLDIKEGMVEEISVKSGRMSGVKTSLNETYVTKSLIVTPGTFLNGLIHIGLEHTQGGRIGEKNSTGLSSALNRLGLKLGRLKTGTCARLDGKTIDFSRLTPQYGDDPITPFSFQTARIPREQLPCYITYTNKNTHDIIRENLDRSPLFTGIIKGTGVRYCPSIEDKIYRFPDRDRHHIFLEPEGLNTTEYYPNGISTSLPIDAQEKLVNSIEGLENARITKPGYGIEYDYIEPTQLYPTMETKEISGLYLAGQINGTTGYEEAAGLGLMAGINAALKIKEEQPLILKRSQAYIGVLIDDLVTKGTSEPYRMFTSRVEYRLLLREDNADSRLTPVGHGIGLVNDKQYERAMTKKGKVDKAIARLKGSRMEKALRRPGASYNDTICLLEGASREAMELFPEEIKEVEIEVKYEGFIKRQLSEVARLDKIERIKVPAGIQYKEIHGLSSEIKEKLLTARPTDLGQASRISGVTPAAISILMVYIEKTRRREAL